jgi:hypothetical protein
MRTKSAYRENKFEGENKPAVEATVPPSPEAPAVAVEVRPESEPQPQPPDEAALALQKQIAELRRSEELNRHAAEQAVRMPQRPLTREEKLAAWQQQGMPADQLEFLKANPELVDYSELAAFAANEAAQAGHERGSRQHMEATKQAFDQHFARLQAQAQHQTESAMQESKFFAPLPLPKPRTTSIVSAPVSREIPSGGPRSEFETNPGRVVLSPDEKIIAKNSGISEVEYARNKIRMMHMKASGEIQG